MFIHFKMIVLKSEGIKEKIESINIAFPYDATALNFLYKI